jgi:hypothetical protein
MSTPPDQRVILISKHLAQAIEWVLTPSKGNAPDLSRLTSEQMQLLPLPIAEAFMDLALAALQGPPPSVPSYSFWADARTTQRARRNRQRASSLTAAHRRLLTWYVQTANAQHKHSSK